MLTFLTNSVLTKKNSARKNRTNRFAPGLEILEDRQLLDGGLSGSLAPLDAGANENAIVQEVTIPSGEQFASSQRNQAVAGQPWALSFHVMSHRNGKDAKPSDFTVTIHWGDGKTSAATLSPTSSFGRLEATATHVYAQPGKYYLRAAVHEKSHYSRVPDAHDEHWLERSVVVANNTEKAPEKRADDTDSFKGHLQYDEIKARNAIREAVTEFGKGFVGSAKKLWRFMTNDPVANQKAIAQGIWQAVTHPAKTAGALADALKAGIGEFQNNPARSLGGLTFDLMLGKFTKLAQAKLLKHGTSLPGVSKLNPDKGLRALHPKAVTNINKALNNPAVAGRIDQKIIGAVRKVPAVRAGKIIEQYLIKMHKGLDLNRLQQNFPIVDMLSKGKYVSIAVGNVKYLKDKFRILVAIGTTKHNSMLDALGKQFNGGKRLPASEFLRNAELLTTSPANAAKVRSWIAREARKHGLSDFLHHETYKHLKDAFPNQTDAQRIKRLQDMVKSHY